MGQDDRTPRDSFQLATNGGWFRDLFEHAPLCVFEEDFSRGQLRIIQANRRAVDTYGWSRRELTQLDPLEMVPPESRDDFQRIMEAVRSGRTITTESTNRRRDGRVFPVRVSASATTQEGRAIVMVEDISQSRQAEATLRALLNASQDRALLLETDGTIVELNVEAARNLGSRPEELKGRKLREFFPDELTALRRKHFRAAIETGRLQRIVDNTWDIIFQMDLAGNYTFGNKAAERILGYRLDQLLRMNYTQIVAPEDVDTVRQRIQARLEGKPLSQPFSFAAIRADGERIFLELSTTGVYEDGVLVAIQGVARNITRRRRTEQALRDAHRKLITAREDERRHLARELHDSLGQQLAAMRLLLRNALNECDAENIRKAHEQLVRSSQMCNTMVSEVREICQGLYPAALESLGLAAAIRDLCSQCDMCHITCCCGLESGGEDVRFPTEIEIALYRVAQEALSNALRHANAEHICFDLDSDEQRVTLRVTDDGKGFDPENVAGHGLGLSSMTERMEAVGGTLDINSRPGHTEVVATVPLGENPSE
ncbi:MAG: PAS domain-containing sensor histidine kinase [Phycisphaerae bacterium]